MMKLILFFFFAATIVFPAYGERTSVYTTVPEKSIEGCTPSPLFFTIGPGDTVAFLARAMEGGLMEIKYGKIALKKGSSKQVRDFARQMILDHGVTNAKIKLLAKSALVSLPHGAYYDGQPPKDLLTENDGASFDIAYMDMMLDEHSAAVTLFEQARGNAPTVAQRSFAIEMLAILRKHFERAFQIRQQLDADRSHIL